MDSFSPLFMSLTLPSHMPFNSFIVFMKVCLMIKIASKQMYVEKRFVPLRSDALKLTGELYNNNENI